MTVFWSPRFAEHGTPPGHPERAERAGVFAEVAERVSASGGVVREPSAATRAELARVHDTAHIDRIAGSAGRSIMLDADTFASPESWEVALLAAGAARDAARHAWAHGEPAWAFVRPPGHHAEPGRAMGFCLFDNVAVAAAALRAEGVGRVAIIDFDVHHGNGTQAAFYLDPTVFFASTHQSPFYPGTGHAYETGAGAGVGTTLNVPLAAGTADDGFLGAYDEAVLPAVEAFGPDVILVSAGFDAHVLDPLGGLRITTQGFAELAARLRALASRVAGGRMAFVTEGGYHLGALRECLALSVGVVT